MFIVFTLANAPTTIVISKSLMTALSGKLLCVFELNGKKCLLLMQFLSNARARKIGWLNLVMH
jgi:hypothetical protein